MTARAAAKFQATRIAALISGNCHRRSPYLRQNTFCRSRDDRQCAQQRLHGRQRQRIYVVAMHAFGSRDLLQASSSSIRSACFHFIKIAPLKRSQVCRLSSFLRSVKKSTLPMTSVAVLVAATVPISEREILMENLATLFTGARRQRHF